MLRNVRDLFAWRMVWNLVNVIQHSGNHPASYASCAVKHQGKDILAFLRSSGMKYRSMYLTCLLNLGHHVKTTLVTVMPTKHAERYSREQA